MVPTTPLLGEMTLMSNTYCWQASTGMTISTSDPENGGETFTRGVTPAALEATVFILRKLPAKGEEARVESRMLLVLLTCSVLVSLYPQPPRALVGLGVPLGGL